MTEDEIKSTLIVDYKKETIADIVGPNVDKFVAYYKGIKRLHFDWGSSAIDLTPDERAVYLLKVDEDIAKQHNRPLDVKQKEVILKAYEAMDRSIFECQLDIDLWDDYSKEAVDELRARLSRIFGYLEFTQLELGNFLDYKTDTVAIREEMNEKSLARRAKG